jgi:hypothetical protein
LQKGFAPMMDEDNEMFIKQGYLIKENFLTDEEIRLLTIDLDDFASSKGWNPTLGSFNFAPIVGQTENTLNLGRKLYPLMSKLIGGHNVWINHSHGNINHPCEWDNGFGFHTDGGYVQPEESKKSCEKRFLSPYEFMDRAAALKVGVYLTDTNEENSGATHFIPLEVRKKENIPHPTENRSFPFAKYAIPAKLRRGSIFVFGTKIIHSLRSPNLSVRKAIFVNFALTWLQGLDSTYVREDLKKDFSFEDQILFCNPSLPVLLTIPSTPFVANKLFEIVGRNSRYYPNYEIDTRNL